MRVYITGDLVTGHTNAPEAEEAYEVPTKLEPIIYTSLRFDGTNLADASTYTTFYIDDKGRKHVTKSDTSWQQINCNFSDLLAQNNGSWGVISALSAYQSGAYNQFKNLLYQFVTKVCDFPEWKQVNYLDRYYELGSKDTLSGVEKTELAALKSVRVWKNNLLVYRDQVKNNINKAVTTEEVDSVISNVSFSQPPSDL
jgi:hypothetical protein